MKKKALISFGIALGAALFMLFQGNFFAVQSEEASMTLSPDSVKTSPVQKAAEASPSLQIRVERTSLNDHGTVTLTGNAPAGNPVYIEVWTDQKVRASHFDTSLNKDTGKRPYILSITKQMPAYYKILTPTDKQSVLAALKAQGKSWSYSRALKDFGAEDACSAPLAISISRYQASVLGSVMGSRGKLLPAMDAKENASMAKQLVRERFGSPGTIFVPDVEIKSDGSFSAIIDVPEGAPSGKYNVRALVDRNITSQTVSFENKIGFPYVYLTNAGTSMNLIYPVLLSFVVSIFGVLMGAGGGFILNPLLVSLWPLPHTVVAGTVMPTILFSQGSGIVNYSKIKFINWKLGISIGLAMFLGGFIGPKLTELVTVEQYKFVFGWILVVLSGLMLWQTTPGYLAKNSKEQAILKQYRKKAEETAAAAVPKTA